MVKTTRIKKEVRFFGLRSVSPAVYSAKALQLAPLLVLFLGATLRAQTVQIHSPSAGATVSSPVALSVTMSDANPASLCVYDNGSLILQQWTSSLTTGLTLSSGSHNIVIDAWRGQTEETATVWINVATPSGGTQGPATGSVAPQISNDMTELNEGHPQGVPSSWGFYSGPTFV